MEYIDILFIYDLFNDAVSSLECRKTGNNELEKMWKEAVGARFELLSQLCASRN
jgi:hypothetical protein